MGVLLLAGIGPGAVLTLLTKVAFFFESWGDGPGFFTYGRGGWAGACGLPDGTMGLTVGMGWPGFAG